MSSYKINVNNREDIGSNRVNKLRANSTIPAVMYKKGEETKSLQVDERDFRLTFREAGTTSVIDLDLDGATHPVIVKDVQMHPVKNEFIHIDFQEINMDEKIKVLIPVILHGRDEIQLQPSVLSQLVTEVEVECLPGDIPNTADVEVSHMDFTTVIAVKDLDIAKNEAIEILMDADTVVCTLSEPQEIEEEELEETDEDVDAGDVPVVGDDEEEDKE
nr:50S ribosomal protein L25 [Tissierella sp.]